MKSSIILNLTSSCNMNCSYCYRTMEKFMGLKNISNERSIYSKNISDILKCSEINSVVFTGGEPSLFLGLKNFILKFLPFKDITIITNSLKNFHLEEDIINNINIVVSLDGDYDVLKHSRNVNFIQYTDIIDNIYLYKKKSKKLIINSVITKYNIDCIDYKPFELFGENVNYNFIVPSILFTPKDLSLNQQDYENVIKLVKYYMFKYRYKINCNINLFSKRVFMSNYKNIISNMLTIEYKLETNMFYLFDSSYTSLELAFKDFDNKCNFIEGKLIKYLEEKEDYYKFDPYGLSEMLMFEK